MKKIGCFKKEDGGYTGIISLFNLHVDVRIEPVAVKDASIDPDFMVNKAEAGPFTLELGQAWQKHTRKELIPYLEVEIDDPSCPRPIHAILWKGEGNLYNLFWNRTTVGEQAAERLYVQEELKPPIGSARLPQKMTAFIQQLYPELSL